MEPFQKETKLIESTKDAKTLYLQIKANETRV